MQNLQLKNSGASPKKAGRMTYIRVLTITGCMAAVSVGLCFYVSGLMSASISENLGLLPGQTVTMASFFLAALGLGSMIMPALMNRIPFHLLYLAGAILAAGSTLLLSLGMNAGYLYCFSFLQGAGAACIGLVPAVAVINNWFYKRNTWFLSLVLACPALAAAIFAPVFGFCVNAFGWRMSYILLAIVMLLLLAYGLVSPITLEPEGMGASPYGIKTLEPVKREKPDKSPASYLAVLVVIALSGAALIAIPQHFSQFASSLGAPVESAAAMLTALMLGNLVFKLAGGLICEKRGIFSASAILSLAAVIGSAGLLAAIYSYSQGAVLFFCFLFGAVYSLAELTVPLLCRQRFGRFRYLSVYGFLYGLMAWMSALSIWLTGRIVDGTSSYLWIWIISLILELLILGLVWWAMGGFSKENNPNFILEKKKKEEKKQEEARKNQQNLRASYFKEPPAEKEAAAQEPSFEKEERQPAVFSAVSETIRDESPYSFQTERIDDSSSMKNGEEEPAAAQAEPDVIDAEYTEAPASPEPESRQGSSGQEEPSSAGGKNPKKPDFAG